MDNKPNFKSPSWIAIVALMLIPLGGAIWFGFFSAAPLGIDSAWHSFFTAEHGTILFNVFAFFHVLGSTEGMAVVSFLILVGTLLFRKWSHALTISVTMLTVLAASKTIKMIVARPRPEDMIVIETSTSFPSGHSLGAGAIATVLVCFVFANQRLNKVFRIAAVTFGSGYIVIMILSRTGLHVHWLSDTIAGASLGVALGLLFARIFLFKQPQIARRKGKYAR